LTSIAIALTLHEVGHLIATIIFKIKFQRLKITMFGFNLNANLEGTSLGRKIILFFAGPFLNMIIFFALRCTEYNNFANINIFLALINMIPIVPLDGGNICKSILEKIIDGESVGRYMIMTNCFFIVCFAVIMYINHNWFYFLLIIMSVRGIMEENRYLLEKNIKYNYYKKFKKR
jgi:membrane-associated protease RseP (regulator of RpoE activity)